MPDDGVPAARAPADRSRPGWLRMHERIVARGSTLPAEAQELYGVTFYTCLVGLLAYVVYAPLFVLLGAHVVALANGVVVVVFGLALALVVRGWVFRGMALASTAVAGHAWVAVLQLGGDAGFQLHVILALELGLLFTYVPLRVRLVYAGLFIAAFTGLIAVMRVRPPSTPLAVEVQRGFELLNALIFAGVSVLIAMVYGWSVRGNQLAREAVLRDLEDRNAALAATHVQLAQARDEAQDASKAKSMFLANMSHELRTPLNAIIGYSEMIEEEAAEQGNDALGQEVRRIMGAGRHLLALINDILDLAKIEARQMQCERIEVDLAELTTEVIGTVRTVAEGKGNRLELQIADALPRQLSDPTKIRQILFNLLSNAGKFTEQGTITLAIEAATEGGVPGVRIEVRDTGIGIPADKVDHIFAEFAQADGSTTRRFGGTGLGLTLTKRFAEMLGGRIAVRTEVGVGSTFEVWLPLELPASP